MDELGDLLWLMISKKLKDHNISKELKSQVRLLKVQSVLKGEESNPTSYKD
jgi:hypothetical protein